MWRYPLFVATMWAPILIVVFELFANRVQIKFGHISYQFIIFVSYAFATGLGEALSGYPVFPNSFNWDCSEESGQPCWDNLFSTLVYMLSLQIFFFLALWVLHFFRNKYLMN